MPSYVLNTLPSPTSVRHFLCAPGVVVQDVRIAQVLLSTISSIGILYTSANRNIISLCLCVPFCSLAVHRNRICRPFSFSTLSATRTCVPFPHIRQCLTLSLCDEPPNSTLPYMTRTVLFFLKKKIECLTLYSSLALLNSCPVTACRISDCT